LPRIKGFVTFSGVRSNQMMLIRTNWQDMRRMAAAAALAAVLSACTGAEGDNPTRSAAQAVGWATTVGQPKDFVLARRTNQPLDYVPVGRGGVERPVQPRSIASVRDLEKDLDATRDRSENFARRRLPRGAYGQPLPSVAAPPRPARAARRDARPDPNAPDSYPVSADRARQLRENARNAR
jgi:hypothetical protein